MRFSGTWRGKFLVCLGLEYRLGFVREWFGLVRLLTSSCWRQRLLWPPGLGRGLVRFACWCEYIIL